MTAEAKAPTAAQLQLLAQLGHTAEVADRATASWLIDRLRAGGPQPPRRPPPPSPADLPDPDELSPKAWRS